MLAFFIDIRISNIANTEIFTYYNYVHKISKLYVITLELNIHLSLKYIPEFKLNKYKNCIPEGFF